MPPTTRSGAGTAPTDPAAAVQQGGAAGASRQPTGQNAGQNAGAAGQPLVDSISKVDFLKLAEKFPSFSGDNGQQPEDYLLQFNKMANFTNFSPEDLLKVIPLKFTSIADTWFTELQASSGWTAITAAENPFEAFVEVFIKRFSIGERNQLARDKLRRLEWRGSVVKLASLIQQHAAHTNISDHEQCDRFIQLLPTNMAQHILLMRTSMRLYKFEDAITMAVNYESATPRAKVNTNAGQPSKQTNGQPSSSKSPSSYSGNKKNNAAPGVKDNGTKKPSPKPGAAIRRCWLCNKTGHFKKDCPEAKAVGLNVLDVDNTQKSK